MIWFVTSVTLFLVVVVAMALIYWIRRAERTWKNLRTPEQQALDDEYTRLAVEEMRIRKEKRERGESDVEVFKVVTQTWVKSDSPKTNAPGGSDK